MARISPTQIDSRGFKAGNQVIANYHGKHHIFLLVKLVLEDKVWIGIAINTIKYPHGFTGTMSEEYIKSWHVDKKYLGRTNKDIDPDSIIQHYVKERCGMCQKL